MIKFLEYETTTVFINTLTFAKLRDTSAALCGISNNVQFY